MKHLRILLYTYWMPMFAHINCRPTLQFKTLKLDYPTAVLSNYSRPWPDFKWPALVNLHTSEIYVKFRTHVGLILEKEVRFAFRKQGNACRSEAKQSLAGILRVLRFV